VITRSKIVGLFSSAMATEPLSIFLISRSGIASICGARSMIVRKRRSFFMDKKWDWELYKDCCSDFSISVYQLILGIF